MAGIKVVTCGQARLVSQRRAPGCETHAYISGASDPLHLYRHTLAHGARLPIHGAAADRLVYVLEGEVVVGEHRLEAGSSIVVEHRAAATLSAGAAGASIVEFHDAANSPASRTRAGGHVHAMPNASVPRSRDLGAGNEVGGAIHANAACPTCNIWLHENDFHAAMRSVVPLHVHMQDEIIFVTAGSIRLGTKVYGLGTAIAVAADTLYAFDVPEGGLSFLSFRIGPPHTPMQGGVAQMDETTFWTARVGKPVPIDLTGTTTTQKGAH